MTTPRLPDGSSELGLVQQALDIEHHAAEGPNSDLKDLMRTRAGLITLLGNDLLPPGDLAKVRKSIPEVTNQIRAQRPVYEHQFMQSEQPEQHDQGS